MIDSMQKVGALAERVAVALLARQADGARCAVSRPQLAAELRVNAARVSLAITELVAAGLITVVPRSGTRWRVLAPNAPANASSRSVVSRKPV